MADKVWLEYLGPSGTFIAGDATFGLGVPVEIDGDEAARIMREHPSHNFVQRADGPAADETAETARLAPAGRDLPGPIPAPTSPEGGQDGGMPKVG